MANFAQLNENNIVTQVIVVSNDVIDNLSFPESEPVGVAFLQSLFGSTTVWKQTSYNANFRKNYAGIGYTYDAVNDVFIAPQPFASWSLDEIFDWQPPTPRPNGFGWYWNEDSLSWIEQSL